MSSGAYEWACQTINDPDYGTCLVGCGPVEDRSRAEEDVAAWRSDGYSVRLVRRAVGPWESASGDEASSAGES